MSIFFTADHHFGHTNIIRFHKRPFADAREMDSALIKLWNGSVKQTDTVYHLGDISVLRPERTEKILNQLKGKIFLIRGNHDKSAEDELCVSRFEWVKDYHFLSLNDGVKIALMHYAMRVWDRCHYGAWHLFGHSHGKLPADEKTFSLDVGVDCWDFRPVDLQEIKSVMVKRGWTARSRQKKK